MNPALEKAPYGSNEQAISPGQHPTSPPPAFSTPHGHPSAQSPPPMTYVDQQYVSPQQFPPAGYQQPPPAGYFQQQQQPQSPQQPYQTPQSQYRNATPTPSLGMSPAPVDCPSCGQRAMTNVTSKAGNTTHAWALGLCCLTGLFCFVPYLMNGLKDKQHRCSRCGMLLATWHKSGSVDVHAHA